MNLTALLTSSFGILMLYASLRAWNDCKTDCWVNNFFEYFLRRLLQQLLQSPYRLLRKPSITTLTSCTVNNNTYIIFFLNVTAFFNQKAFNFFTFRSCLMSDKHFTQNFAAYVRTSSRFFATLTPPALPRPPA